jgi:hypothetical protein
MISTCSCIRKKQRLFTQHMKHMQKLKIKKIKNKKKKKLRQASNKRPPQKVFQILRAPTAAGRGRDATSSAYILHLPLSFCCLPVSLGFSCCSLFFSLVPCSCYLIHKPILRLSPHPFNLYLKATHCQIQINRTLSVRS